MRLLYETKLTVTVTDDGWATLDDFDVAKRCEDIEQIIGGPAGEALVNAIIVALDDPDTFDVTLA